MYRSVLSFEGTRKIAAEYAAGINELGKRRDPCLMMATTRRVNPIGIRAA